MEGNGCSDMGGSLNSNRNLDGKNDKTPIGKEREQINTAYVEVLHTATQRHSSPNITSRYYIDVTPREMTDALEKTIKGYKSLSVKLSRRNILRIIT